jgi:hypothetical protein
LLLEKARVLNDALSVLPDYKGYVYRGLRNVPPEFADREAFLRAIDEQYSVGVELFYPSFTSTAAKESSSFEGDGSVRH